MGKASRNKQFRKIARDLPELSQVITEKDAISGAELIKQGVLQDKQGNPILPSKQYTRHRQVVSDSPLNHARQLRKAYQRMGRTGIFGYIDAVESHVDKVTKAAEASVQPGADEAVTAAVAHEEEQV